MIYDVTRDLYVAVHPVEAVSPWMRLRGMIGRRFDADAMDAMIFERCSAIHSCFMGMKFDALFLDSGNVVVSMREKIAPWRMVTGGVSAVTVIELPEGRIAASGVQKGDVLNIHSALDPEQVKNLPVDVMFNRAISEKSKTAEVKNCKERS